MGGRAVRHVYEAAALWCVALSLWQQPARADGLGGSIELTSDYLYRAATQTSHDPAVQLDLHYYGAAGWMGGVWASNVRQYVFGPIGAEIDPYLGFRHAISDQWSTQLTVVRHLYIGSNPPQKYDFSELSGTLAFRSELFMTLTVSPDTLVQTSEYDFRRRDALTGDVSLHHSLAYALSANAGLGYYRLQQSSSNGYPYGSVGLGYDLGSLHLDLSFVAVDRQAREFYYFDQASNRLVGSAMWHF